MDSICLDHDRFGHSPYDLFRDIGSNGCYVRLNERWLTDCAKNPLGSGRRVCWLRNIVEDDGKLVAAEPGDRVEFTNARPKALGHLDKQDIPDGMAERVVDILEMIEIEIQYREAGEAPARPCDRLLESLDEDTPVREACQAIVARHPRDLLFRPFLIGNVTCKAQELTCGPPEGDAALDVDNGAIFPPVQRFEAIEAGFHNRCHMTLGRLGRFDSFDIPNTQLQQFLARIAGHAAIGFVHREKSSVPVEQPEPIGGGSQHGRVLFGLETDGLRGAFTLGDIPVDADHSCGTTIGRTLHQGMSFNVVHLTVGPQRHGTQC